MKKFMLPLMVAGMLFMAGCGSSEKVIEGAVNGTASGTQTKEAEETGETQEEAAEENGEAGSRGYVFSWQDIVVAVDADMEEAAEKLGEPASYYEAASCAFDGLSKIYTYNSFVIETYPMGDADYVSAIILKDDSVMTAEGVAIGDTREKLEQTYGTESTEENGMLVYEKDGMKLCFILQEDEIISIEYRSTVLDE